MDISLENINLSSLDLNLIEEYFQKRAEKDENYTYSSEVFEETEDQPAILSTEESGSTENTQLFIEYLDEALSDKNFMINVNADGQGPVTSSEMRSFFSAVLENNGESSDVSLSVLNQALSQIGVNVNQFEEAIEAQSQQGTTVFSSDSGEFNENWQITSSSNEFSTDPNVRAEMLDVADVQDPGEPPSTMEVLQDNLASIDSAIRRTKGDLQLFRGALTETNKNLITFRNSLINNAGVQDELENNKQAQDIDKAIAANGSAYDTLNGQIPSLETAVTVAQVKIDSLTTTITTLNTNIAQYEYDMKFAMKEVTETLPDGSTHTYNTTDFEAQEQARQNLFQAREDLKIAEGEKIQAQNQKLEAEIAREEAEKQLVALQIEASELTRTKTTLVLNITAELAKTNEAIATLRDKVIETQQTADRYTNNIRTYQDRINSLMEQKQSVMEQINAENEKEKNMNTEQVIAGVYGEEAMNANGVYSMDWSNPDASVVETTVVDGQVVYKIGDVIIDEATLQQEANSLASSVGANSYSLSLASLMKLDLADGTADGHISSDVQSYQDAATTAWSNANPDYFETSSLANSFYMETVDDDQTGDIWITNRDNSNQARIQVDEGTVTFGMGDNMDSSTARTIQDQNGWVAGGLDRDLYKKEPDEETI